MQHDLERQSLTPWAWLIAAAAFVFFIATARGYGIFRDELYYLACSEHLGLGYVDQPPMIAWITWAVRHTLGTSLLALRALPAAAAAATILASAWIARELGGGRFAQCLTALCIAAAPVYLSLFTILSMNAFDILLWALALAVLVRLLASDRPRLWIAFGALVGIGLENKLSMLFLGFGVVGRTDPDSGPPSAADRVAVARGPHRLRCCSSPHVHVAGEPRLADRRVHPQRHREQEPPLVAAGLPRLAGTGPQPRRRCRLDRRARRTARGSLGQALADDRLGLPRHPRGDGSPARQALLPEPGLPGAVRRRCGRPRAGERRTHDGGCG